MGEEGDCSEAGSTVASVVGKRRGERGEAGDSVALPRPNPSSTLGVCEGPSLLKIPTVVLEDPSPPSGQGRTVSFRI